MERSSSFVTPSAGKVLEPTSATGIVKRVGYGIGVE
jgi:hypothetical protein